jgi:hypothetical protein
VKAPVKTATAAAAEAIVDLWQKLCVERATLNRRIGGLETALEAIGHKLPSKSKPVLVPVDGEPKRIPQMGRRKEELMRAKVGFPLKYLVKEALHDGAKNLKELGTYLARRGVDPVVPNNVSVVLTTLTADGLFDRSAEGVWSLTEKGQEEMDKARAASA